MLQKHQAKLKFANIVSDLLILMVSCYFGWIIRYDFLDGIMSLQASSRMIALIMMLFSLFNILVLYICNIYAPQRLHKVGSNTFRIALANIFCSLILMSVLYVFHIDDVPRLAIGLSWLISTVLISVKHAILHFALHRARMKGYNLRHYVLIGNGHLAHQYVDNLKENTFTGVTVSGYLGDEVREELGKYLGTYDKLEEVLEKERYDGLIIALEADEISHMRSILAVADKEGMQVDLIPFFNDYYPTFPTFELLGSTKLIDLRATPLNQPVNAFMKRMFDIVFSALFLIVFSPVMLILAVGVKLSSPGPIIFQQKRMGKDKKLFVMYKFRSMRVTATQETGWSRDTDPRKTKFGSFIRKFSLDEFPQFFNVLKGDMSIVGPRPELPFHVNHFKNEIPRYLVRQQVRPGITGWAQVNGFRGDTSIEERVRYDIEYIENWTIGFDLRIILKTVFGAMINQEQV